MGISKEKVFGFLREGGETGKDELRKLIVQMFDQDDEGRLAEMGRVLRSYYEEVVSPGLNADGGTCYEAVSYNVDHKGRMRLVCKDGDERVLVDPLTGESMNTSESPVYRSKLDDLGVDSLFEICQAGSIFPSSPRSLDARQEAYFGRSSASDH